MCGSLRSHKVKVKTFFGQGNTGKSSELCVDSLQSPKVPRNLTQAWRSQ
jgi:hypothetical protein